MKAHAALKMQIKPFTDMKFILFLLVFVIGCSTAPKKIQKPFYWTTQHQGKEYFFLGTMHAGFTLQDLPSFIIEDIKNSKLVAIEVDDKLVKNFQASQEKALQKYLLNMFAYYPDLQKKLSERAWKNLKFTLNHEDVEKFMKDVQTKTGQKIPLTEDKQKHLHPAFIVYLTSHFGVEHMTHVFNDDVMTGISPLANKAYKKEMRSVLDSEVIKLASEQNIPVIPLDNLKLVTEAYNALQGDYGISFIENFYGVKSDDESLEAFNTIRANFESGEESRMEESLKLLKEYEGPILYKRNLHWFEKLKSRKEKKIFVAVGAFHLIGKDSILQLFEREGAKVVRQKR